MTRRLPRSARWASAGSNRGPTLTPGARSVRAGSRVDRHRRLAESDDGTRHWHVDYLLPVASVRDVFTAKGAAVECKVARALPGDRVAGFGASDCDCDSHLAFAPAESTLRIALERLYAHSERLDRA